MPPKCNMFLLYLTILHSIYKRNATLGLINGRMIKLKGNLTNINLTKREKKEKICKNLKKYPAVVVWIVRALLSHSVEEYVLAIGGSNPAWVINMVMSVGTVICTCVSCKKLYGMII